MIFTRIIAVAAFAFHVLVGCGWHQHEVNFASDHGHSCSVVAHQGCGSPTENIPAQPDVPSGDHGDCEVVSCVYIGVPQLKAPLPTDVSVVPFVVPALLAFDEACLHCELDTGELFPPHVPRHVALRYFLN